MKIHFQEDPDEEMLAAFFATYDYARGLKSEEDKRVNYEKGKSMTPWLLNKRLKSI